MSKEESFEAALAGLEQAVAALESGRLTLDEALATFEQGVGYAGRCRQRLQQAETRVQLLLQERDGSLKVQDADEL